MSVRIRTKSRLMEIRNYVGAFRLNRRIFVTIDTAEHQTGDTRRVVRLPDFTTFGLDVCTMIEPTKIEIVEV